MDAETTKRLHGLTYLFGQNGSKIFKILTDYVAAFRKINNSSFPQVTIITVINSILDYIETYNPTKEQDPPDVNAGNVAYDKIIRRYYIQTIFANENRKPGVALLNLIAGCLSNNENVTQISTVIDEFIKLQLRLRPSSVLIQDAEEARQKAEETARTRGQQSYGQEATATLGDRLGRGQIPSSDQSHMFENEDNPIREAILDIKSIMRLDLTDPGVRLSIFSKLIELFPSIQQEKINEEIDQLIKDRESMPPSPDFTIGIFTPNQQKRLEKAKELGWQYGGPAPEFFPRAPGGYAPGGSAAGRGGNKKTKSKKITKRYYKSKRCSKRHSIRRRRRNSYKK